MMLVLPKETTPLKQVFTATCTECGVGGELTISNADFAQVKAAYNGPDVDIAKMLTDIKVKDIEEWHSGNCRA